MICQKWHQHTSKMVTLKLLFWFFLFRMLSVEKEMEILLEIMAKCEILCSTVLLDKKSRTSCLWMLALSAFESGFKSTHVFYTTTYVNFCVCRRIADKTISFCCGIFHVWIWTRPLLKIGMSIKNKKKTNDKQYRSWWDGSWSSESTLFVKVLFWFTGPKKINLIIQTVAKRTTTHVENMPI